MFRSKEDRWVSRIFGLVTWLGSASVVAAVCPPSPQLDCRQVRRSQFIVRNDADDNLDRLKLMLRSGSSASLDDFADPTGLAGGYDLCLYGAGSLIDEVNIPGGGTCGAHPCWVGMTRGYKFRDPAAGNDGITKLVVRADSGFQTGASVNGRGGMLPDLTYPLDTPVTVQIVNTQTDVCYGASYDSADVTANSSATGFKGARRAQTFPPLRAFVTANEYDGNLGGLTGADAVCQAEADAASVGGRWIAALSTTKRALRRRLAPAAYYRMDGITLIGQDLRKTLGFVPTGPLNQQADGSLVSPKLVWTGSQTTGRPDRKHTCNDWTTATLGVFGANGQTHTFDVGMFLNGGFIVCAIPQRLLCFELP